MSYPPVPLPKPPVPRVPIPLPKLPVPRVPGIVQQFPGGPTTLPVVPGIVHGVPKPPGTVSVVCGNYMRYRVAIGYLAQTVTGFSGSAEWFSYFKPGTTLDLKIKNLYIAAGLGQTTEGSWPPGGNSDFIMLTNDTPSLALRNVAWVDSAMRATILWSSHALHNPTVVPPSPLVQLHGPVPISSALTGLPATGPGLLVPAVWQARGPFPITAPVVAPL